MKKTLKCSVLVLLAAWTGCAEPRVPADYRLDTTPAHDGEHWIGGK